MEGMRVLLVDDEENMLESLSDVLGKEGYRISTAENGRIALGKLADEEFDVVVADIRMPVMDGMELLERIKVRYPSTDVVMLTAYGTIENAVSAVKMGAYEYLLKPLEPERILETLKEISQRRGWEKPSAGVPVGEEEEYAFDGVTGINERMLKVHEMVRKVARTDCNVLILGESGTGKELIANALHTNSLRSSKPFVAINCAALTETIIESELFGHEKGAFTDARYTKKGKFEVADGGTLFLDEIGSMSLRMQTKLLRVLQQKEFERVGGIKTIRVDVRVISATSGDLMKQIKDGHFREDLYYRLNVVPIYIPPLRDRKEDIPLLANFFLRKHASKLGKKVESISRDAMDLMTSYDWPGNVRELENVIERAVIFTTGNAMTSDDLWGKSGEFVVGGDSPHNAGAEPSRSLPGMERDLIIKALKDTNWNISRAARILKISRGTLYSKIEKHGISKEDTLS